MSKEDTHRVQFVANDGLVGQADAVAEILSMSRTELIKRAIHGYLDGKRRDDQFRRQAQEAFIDDRIDEETFRQALGTEELVIAKRLEATFETLGEGVPDPSDVPEIPSDEEFYGNAEQENVIEVEEGTQVIEFEEDSHIVVRPSSEEEETETANPEDA